MNNIDLSNYKSLHLKTSREYLSDIKKNLESLNTNPADKKIIYEIFRLFHSLKSQNFFMGYEKSAHLCKSFEDYFRAINDGKNTYLPKHTTTIMECVRILESSLDSIEKNNSELDLSKDIINLEAKLAE